jgi:hypothetical protein
MDNQHASLQRTDGFDMVECLPERYLRVGVNPKNRCSAVGRETSGNQITAPIGNGYLFRLGIALLELAYRGPLCSLRRNTATTTATDFDISDQCSRTVASTLEARYAKVVRKCIGCDFGEDNDLSRQELRVAVHKDVVLKTGGPGAGL